MSSLFCGVLSGVLNGKVAPGAIDGSGAIGLATLLNGSDGMVAEQVRRLTGGRRVDKAIEAVGIPATFNLRLTMVASSWRACSRPTTLFARRLPRRR